MIGDQTLAPVMVVVTLCVLLVGQTSKPERNVESNVITSLRDPQVRIELPKSAQYVGADRWILYDIADCELHAFVEADAQKNVQRLYWVQFESYLPSRPELRHKYDSPRHMQMDGMDFYVDTWVRGIDSSIREGSDLEHILALIRGKGYRVPPGMMSVRLVILLDEQKRKELMIIYSEDIVPTGFTANQAEQLRTLVTITRRDALGSRRARIHQLRFPALTDISRTKVLKAQRNISALLAISHTAHHFSQ